VGFDRLTCGHLVALLGAAGFPAAPLIGQAAPDSAPESRAPARLFATAEPLNFTLTADFGAINKQRGDEKHELSGILSYASPAGDSVRVGVQLRTRGHFRLKICQYPPLKVTFDREHTAHTEFAHQRSLKLTVQCRGGRSWANYVLEEYLIYRSYNLLTDKSFRVRLAHVTYADATGKHAPETRNAFFVEDDDRMARRNQAGVLAVKGARQGDMDSAQMALTAVFQYMIGNTDWAVSALHNIVIIRDSTHELFAVPYDFDWSGVIWTPYARPDERLGIPTVRERLFRGACRTPAQLAAAFAPFNQQKDAIYGLYRGMIAEGLEPKRVEQALDYYDEFYKTINDAGRVRRAFIVGCHES
jgi:hypothetical protein